MSAHEQEVVVDPDLCVGSATCVGIAPNIFELIDGVAHGGAITTPSDMELAQEAMDACPVLAISLLPFVQGSEDE